MKSAISGHRWSSAVISGHQRSSVVIRGHQRSSARDICAPAAATEASNCRKGEGTAVAPGLCGPSPVGRSCGAGPSAASSASTSASTGGGMPRPLSAARRRIASSCAEASCSTRSGERGEELEASKAGRGEAGRGEAGRGEAGRAGAGRGGAGRGEAGRGDGAPSRANGTAGVARLRERRGGAGAAVARVPLRAPVHVGRGEAYPSPVGIQGGGGAGSPARTSEKKPEPATMLNGLSLMW